MSDDTLLAAESLLATLAAAQAHLEHLAASHLPYAAAARVHRNSVHRAHELLDELGIRPVGLLTLADVVLVEGPPQLRPRHQLRKTAQLLQTAVPTLAQQPEDEAPLDEDVTSLPDDAILVGAGGEDAPLATVEPSDESGGLFEIPADMQHLPEPEPEPSEYTGPLVSFEEEDDEDEDEDAPSSPLVSFEEPLVQFDEPEEELGDQDTLVHFDAEDTLTQLEDLVTSDQPLVQFVDFEEDEEDTQETADTPPSDDEEMTPSVPEAIVPDSPLSSVETYQIQDDRTALPDEEATLLADLEGLMQTRELEPVAPDPPSLDLEFVELAEDSDPDSTDMEFHDESSVSEVIVTKKEAATSEPPPKRRPPAEAEPPPPEPLPEPEEEAPTPRVTQPRSVTPKPTKKRTRRAKPKKVSPTAAQPRRSAPTPSGAEPRYSPSAYAGSVPTIRDGPGARPKAAAIRLSADEKSSMVLGQEEELLEMGAAIEIDEEYQDDPSSSGFRLQVEEYEEIEYVDELEDEEEAEVAMAAPPPIPVLVTPTTEELRQMYDDAVAARERGRMDDAVNLFSDILDADPDHVEAHLGRGRVFLDLADYARAMSDFTVAEDLAPESADPLVALGDFYFARKEYTKAIGYFDEALKVQDDHAMAHCRRGISHYYRRDYDSAVRDLTRAKKIDPEIPNIATFLATAKKRARR